MKLVKIGTSIVVASTLLNLVASVIHSKPSHADVPPSCQKLVNELFEHSDKGYYFNSSYARVARRESHGIYNSASTRSFHMATKGNEDVIKGSFNSQFSDDNRQDRTTLRIYRSGRIEVVLNSWGNTTLAVDPVSCTSGKFLTLQGKYLEGHPTLSLISVGFVPQTLR